MKLSELSDKLKLTKVVGAIEDTEVTGCYIGDLLSWVMGRADEGDIWLTIMGNANVVAVARLTDVAAVLVCEDAPIDDDAVARATENGIPIYKTTLTIFESAKAVADLLGD